jgi:sodium-dependent dicarboxylate transporter 2/3/5
VYTAGVRQGGKLLLGVALAGGAYAACRAAGASSPAASTALVTALCASYWITEALPIPVTSLIPFVAFPLLAVASPKELAGAYGHPLILLLLGGFILSKAMEQSGAHRRLAMIMLHLLGGDAGKRLVLGFMVTSALLSMWISNSATTLMLLPVALAVLDREQGSETAQQLAGPLLLGIAYAASIGGLGTPIGTPPNVAFMAVYNETFGREVTFLDWMRLGVPATLVLLPIAYWVLTRKLETRGRFDLPEIGRWTSAERRVLCVFAATAAAWVFRSEPYGGWQQLLGGAKVDDSTVALAAVVVMFLVPDGAGKRLLKWETAATIPWGLLLLFAGGLAIAKAFETSGLSALLASGLGSAAGWPEIVMIGLVCLVVTFLTEVTSNTATAALLLPVLAAAAQATGTEPMKLMIPATLSASCAFMLPVATVPNAVVFGTGRFTTGDMARHGLWLNLLGAAALTLLCTLLL